MKLLLLAILLGLTGAYPLEDNKECQPHSRPWQVYLRSDGVSRSGALIDKWWILTSFDYGLTADNTIASLGEHDKSVEEGTEQHIRISKVIHHNSYRSPLHSLTMIRLAEPASFNQYVQPIPLPSRCTYPGETCYVSGWGSTIPNQYEPTNQLKCITVPIVDDETCMNTFPEYTYWGPGMVCAGQENTDNCMYDQGSVMVCDCQLQGLRWYGHGCNNPADPTVYTKLCRYNDWINSVMEQYAPTTTPPMMAK